MQLATKSNTAILRLCLIALLMFVNTEFTHAQKSKEFNPAAAKGQLGLPQTKVLVLGITHIDAASGKFQTAWLEPILCACVLKPDVIIKEALPGEQI